jgi:hypothetical protein
LLFVVCCSLFVVRFSLFPGCLKIEQVSISVRTLV